MKKLVVSVAAALLFITSNACPFCGCGGSNLYIGLLPDFQRGFIGMRYHYSQYHTTLVNDASQFSTNYYNMLEVWGGISINKKFQVLAFMPYYFNRQVDDDGITNPHGIGDISVLGQYKVFSSTHLSHNQRVVQQQLLIGAGLKFASGNFNLDLKDADVTVADINAQLGTGSTDVLLNSLYNIRVENFGVNASASYSINTVNSQHYKYGNKFTSNLIAYYRLGSAKLGIAPNAGINYENIAGNLLHKSKVEFTGSNVTNAQIGIEFNFRKIGLGLNGQVPVAQNFAEGQTQLKFKGIAHITLAL